MAREMSKNVRVDFFETVCYTEFIEITVKILLFGDERDVCFRTNERNAS